MECIEKSLRKGSSVEKRIEGMGMNASCVYMQLGKKCFTLDKVAENLLKKVVVFYLLPRLIDWLCIVLRPAQEFFTYILPVKGCKVWSFDRHSGPSSRKGSLNIVPHLLWHGTSVFRSHPKDRPGPFSLLLQHTRGCGGSILTRILTSCYQENVSIMHLFCQYAILWIVQITIWTHRRAS